MICFLEGDARAARRSHQRRLLFGKFPSRCFEPSGGLLLGPYLLKLIGCALTLYLVNNGVL